MSGIALEGIQIVELAELVSAPFASKLLADFGADVIKIERPGIGDPIRRFGPFADDTPDHDCGGMYRYLNANKRGVTLDVQQPTARALLYRLLQKADVFIVDRLAADRVRDGLDFATLHELNPRLIITSVTPFGLTGSWRNYRATEIVTVHAGGVGYLTPRGAKDQERPPLKAGARLASTLTGLNAAAATVAALLARRRVGVGQEVDISAQDCLLPVLRRPLAIYFMQGEIASRFEPTWTVGPLSVLECRDGHVFVGIVEDHQWCQLVNLLGLPELGTDARFLDGPSRAARATEIDAILTEALRKWSKLDFSRAGQARGVPCAPVTTAPDLLASEQLREREFFIEGDGGLTTPGAPFKLSATPARQRRPAPKLGEHNVEVFGEGLGMPRFNLVKLRQVGAI